MQITGIFLRAHLKIIFTKGILPKKTAKKEKCANKIDVRAANVYLLIEILRNL